MIKRIGALYHRHARFIPIVFFILGFCFDVLMLQRIDELSVILQQAAYLLVSGFLIGVDLLEESGTVTPPRFLLRFWKYREALLHFLLGTLLNSYAIFYFKSASALTSFVFIAALVLVLILNEFKRFGKSQTRVHLAFLSLCLVSYLVSLAPILLGFMGALPFLAAVAGSLVVYYAYFIVMRTKLGRESPLLKTHLIYPFVSVLSVFVLLYFAHAIPPVPLSIKYLGIFHGVEKTDSGYELTFTRDGWKFWQHGDQDFYARPGDTLFCYVQIFSPARFQDQLQVRWLSRNAKGNWVSSDAIPLSVSGGREEGFRAVTKKNNFQPGIWRVQVETMDNFEVGRITFEVIEDLTTEPRILHKVIH